MANKVTKITSGLIKWRRKQKRGAIMKPETFAEIEASAKAQGLSPERAQKAAGAAYWLAARTKYRKSK